MIETEDPLIRPQKRIEKIRRAVSYFFLRFIQTLIRAATRVVRGTYDFYMWFRKLPRWRKLLFVVIFLGMFAVAKFAVAKHDELNQLKEQKQQIEEQKQQIEQQLEQKEEKIEELHETIEKKDEEIKELTLKRERQRKIAYNATRTPYNGVLEGKVSHYSRAGCLGCSPNLTMANGEPLDDTRLTIAVPPGTIPMNTQVKLVNETNGKEVIATVTDTGGFAGLGRVADLTPAVASALETKTDISQVRIEPIN